MGNEKVGGEESRGGGGGGGEHPKLQILQLLWVYAGIIPFNKDLLSYLWRSCRTLPQLCVRFSQQQYTPPPPFRPLPSAEMHTPWQG